MWLVSATSVIILSSWLAFLPDIAHVRLQAGCESKAETFTTLLITELAWLAKVKGKVKVSHHLMLRPANGNTVSQWFTSLLILVSVCATTFRVSTRCQFALADFCARHFCLCWSACHGLLCVFRDGGFLHCDLRNASALPGWHTKKQQWPVLLRRVTNLADSHLSLRSASQSFQRSNSAVSARTEIDQNYKVPCLSVSQVRKKPSSHALRQQPRSNPALPNAT